MIKGKEKFEISDLDDLGKWDDALDKLEKKFKVGTSYTVYLLDHKKNRTLNANRYYFGVVLKTIADHMGQKNLDITGDDLHEVLKGRFNPKVVMVDGQAVEIGETTKKMSQDKFVEYIEVIRDWSSDRLNCYIPLPTEVVEADFGDLYVGAYHNHK